MRREPSSISPAPEADESSPPEAKTEAPPRPELAAVTLPTSDVPLPREARERPRPARRRRPRARRPRDSGVRPAALLARARRPADATGNSETDLPVAPTSIGAMLRRERRLHGASLEEIATTTRIPLKMLRHIEADEMEELPGEVFARGFIKAYARALGLDPELFANGVVPPPADASPSPLGSVHTPERGKRFGIAIAIVVLAILFSLALSIVLRPRHREVPLELSQLDTPTAEFDTLV